MSKDKFIVLACDGIWDCLENAECCEKINKLYASKNASNSNLSVIVEGIFDEILAPDTETGVGTDNMTCIVLYFKQ